MMSQSVSENNVSLVIKRGELSKVVRAFKRELLMEDPDVLDKSDGTCKNFFEQGRK